MSAQDASSPTVFARYTISTKRCNKGRPKKQRSKKWPGMSLWAGSVNQKNWGRSLHSWPHSKLPTSPELLSRLMVALCDRCCEGTALCLSGFAAGNQNIYITKLLAKCETFKE